MEHITAAAILVVIMFCLQCWLAIWSRRADRMRMVAVALSVLSLPVIAAAGLESLSWARPLWAMYALPKEVHVLAAKMTQTGAITGHVDPRGEPPTAQPPGRRGEGGDATCERPSPAPDQAIWQTPRCSQRR